MKTADNVCKTPSQYDHYHTFCLQQQKEGEKKSSRLGLAMSLITATFPLAYCTLFPWLGSVMELTGILAIPLYLAAAFSCMAALLFLLIGL